MDREELLFEEFLAARMKERGVSLKRLVEATGIAPSHIENLLHGNFDELPSAPYFRGYLIRIGKVLDFDGEEWWMRLRKEDYVKNSGPADAMPENRFVKRALPKLFWGIGVAAVVLIIYFAFQFSRIFGRPVLIITSPNESPYTAASSILTIEGTVRNADALYLSNGTGASSSEEITIAPDGTWQKTVLLQPGLNAFEITARKLLGSETTLTEEILYGNPAVTGSSSATSSVQSPVFPTVHFSSTTPATGTYFE